MAASPIPTPDPPSTEPPPSRARGFGPVAVPRPMARCECAGIAFVEVARRIFVEGQVLPEALRGTGCGQICGACIPDLQRHLAHRG
jgi:NAD(P)H-nitrite reductase large subunit